MYKNVMRYWSRAAIRKLFIYHLIFFFILTPFLASCGGGSSGGQDNPEPPTPAEAAANAAESQNRSAQTAIGSIIEMMETLKDGKELIEDTFGDLNPTREDIEAYFASSPQEAESLSAQLDTLVDDILLATENFLISSEQMLEMERTINNNLDTSGSTTATTYRTAQVGFLELLLAVTLIGIAFELAKDESESVNDAVIDDAEAAAAAAEDGVDENDLGEIATRNCHNIGRIWSSRPESLGEHGKTIVSNGALMAGSEVAGAANLRRLKIGIDAYSTYDASESTANGIVGIKVCSDLEDRVSNNLIPHIRKELDVDYESLGPGEIYIGTPDETGTFHNVPPGNWTFIVFADGYLRTVTQCIDATGPSPIEVHVTPVPLEAIEDLLVDSPDEVTNADLWQGYPNPEYCSMEGEEGTISIGGYSTFVLCSYHENGKISVESPYTDEKLDGVVKTYYDNGQLHWAIPYTDGKHNGMEKLFYENGQIDEERPYTDGEKNGVWRGYYESGQLRYERPHADDKASGVWKIYYEDGQLMEKRHYTDDKLNGVLEFYYENGQLKYEHNYVDDEKDGMSNEYFENGQLEVESFYADGELNGVRKVYYEDGRLRSCWYYENGVRKESCM